MSADDERIPPEMFKGKKTGVTMADILALPDMSRTIATELLKVQEAGLTELASLIKEDEATIQALIDELIAQGFIQDVWHEGENLPRYRISLIARRGRGLQLDL
jgi:predicted transcriptional regulator